MTQTAPSAPQTLGRTAERLSPAIWLGLALAAIAGVAALVLPPGVARMALTSAAVTLGCLAALIAVLARREGRRPAAPDRIAALIADDPCPSLVTDAEGRIAALNPPAQDRVGPCAGRPLAGVLAGLLPNPGAILYRMQTRAADGGSAREEVETARGPLRLSVHRIGPGRWLWRLDDPAAAEGPGLPMLTLGKTGAIEAMNDAMRALVGGRVRTLDRIFPYLPLRSGEETEVHGPDGALRCIVAERDIGAGRREVYLLPVPESARPAAARADFEDLPLAIAQVSPGGEVRKANRQARDLLGLPPCGDGPPPRLATLLEGPGRPVGDWLADAMAGLAENRPQVLRLRRSEPDRFLQVTLRRVSQDGRPGLLAVFNDATELKSLEAQIVQSQKMQAIGQLAGGVAHDFNNLLTAISGHCDLLLLRHDRGDPDYADLVQIHQNANRAASLVRQLLAFSRKQTLRPEVFDLRDTLGDLTHLLGRLVGERIALVLDHDPELRRVRADRRQIEQVIMNLVVNARDAMPAGGDIRIETCNRTLGAELRRDRAMVPPGDYVQVRVSDDGAGIAPDNMAKVFEPFFTTKRAGEGTGLGLSTAYGIVKQTGGFIFVDSAPGKGTTFTLYLPACDCAPEAETPAPADAAPAPAVRTLPAPPPPTPGRDGAAVILLAEDEAPVRAFAARALRMQGYTVIEAETAEEALETLEDATLQVDLFLTDVIMPGMDGPGWVRQALGQRPHARVIFVSGYAEEALSTGRTEIPNALFLPKPFSLAELTATVHRQLS